MESAVYSRGVRERFGGVFVLSVGFFVWDDLENRTVGNFSFEMY